MSDINKRYDFVLFFDVQDGNPNGDPDAGNQPRIDAETGMGLVTDVCLKRKVRNYIQLVKAGEAGYDIFVKERAVLNMAIESAWDEANPNLKILSLSAADKNAAEDRARWLMCRKFFDIRAFGAVLSTGDEQKNDGEEKDESKEATEGKKGKTKGKQKRKKTAGQVRGPIQLTFARSVEPIYPVEHSITRMAVTNIDDVEKERTMGRKSTVPYGLYCCHGFISPFLAKQTGFSQEDLELFWTALTQMFEHDRSAARGLMSTRRLIIFEHDSELGSEPASSLFERVRCERAVGSDPEQPARSFSDYRITFDGTELLDLRSVCKCR